MTLIPMNEIFPQPAASVFSESLHRIREVHIDVESILQSLAALQNENPCASCASVCCKEPLCRESIGSDFLRFVLGARADDYSVRDGWYVPGAGCRLGYGRPLVCYEYFCDRFDMAAVISIKQLSRAFKMVYANAFAGRHILAVDDIGRISANKLRIILGRLEALRSQANTVLRQAVNEQLKDQSRVGPAKGPTPEGTKIMLQNASVIDSAQGGALDALYWGRDGANKKGGGDG